MEIQKRKSVFNDTKKEGLDKKKIVKYSSDDSVDSPDSFDMHQELISDIDDVHDKIYSDQKFNNTKEKKKDRSCCYC